MKIAMLGPIGWRTPPGHYGPWEQITYYLTEALVDAGVDVTLFSTLSATTRAKLDGICPTPYYETPGIDGRIAEAEHVAYCFAKSPRFDIVHNNIDWLPVVMEPLCKTTLLSTIHGFGSPAITDTYKKHSSSNYVSISDSNRLPGLNYLATVYHGLDMRQFTLQPKPGKVLVTFGRIDPDKGVAEAIAIAKKAGVPLHIYGIQNNMDYWRDKIEPHIDGKTVRYMGNANPSQRDKALGSALAVLHPIGFDEPFGLTVAEAMACGTPVIAYKRGSMPELIKDGVTGFLVRTVHEAAAAVHKVGALDRSTIRAITEQRFSSATMAAHYIKVYEQLMRARPRHQRALPSPQRAVA